jgi:hypothetical protein
VAVKMSCNATLSQIFTQDQQPVFPWKLHEMLEDAEEEGLSSIVSWLPDGKGFKVLDQAFFVTKILPRYSKQTKYKSFQRQLNIWGFERIVDVWSEHSGGYRHINFVRGQPSLCQKMKRKDIKGTGKSRIRRDSMMKSSYISTLDKKACDTDEIVTQKMVFDIATLDKQVCSTEIVTQKMAFDTEWFCRSFPSDTPFKLLEQDLKYVRIGFEIGKVMHS